LVTSFTTAPLIRLHPLRPVHTLSVCVPSAAPEPASPPHPLLPPWVDPSASAAPPRELGTPDSTAQVHPGLFTKAVLAASGAEVVIGEVERVVVRDGRAAGVVVKGRERDGVVDADAVVLALGPWSGRLKMVSEVRRFWAQGAQHRAAAALAGEGHAALPLPQLPAGAGAKMLHPEVYPRPTSTPLPLVNFPLEVLSINSRVIEGLTCNLYLVYVYVKEQKRVCRSFTKILPISTFSQELLS
jgi:hypothetical protein